MATGEKAINGGVAVEDPEHEQTKEPGRCQLCCSRCYIRCKPYMTKYNPLPDGATRIDKIKHAFLCPPHGKVAKFLSRVFALFFVWAVLWSIFKKEALPPNGNYFNLMVLYICSNLGGWIIEKVRLPPLLGMLIVGGVLRNVPWLKVVGENIDPEWSSSLRTIALVVILTRAGLGLDPVALRKMSLGVVRLAFIPCLVEASCAAVTAFLIMKFRWDFGFMLGFVIAAVSPAVVVPVMLALNDRGYGVKKGIPTLVIAAASIDDVLAISGFSICLSIAFSKGSLAVTIIKGPMELIIGIAYGVALGVLFWYIPHGKFTAKTLFRFILLFFGGMLATFGSSALGLKGAGALGCLTLAFVASLKWRNEVEKGAKIALVPVFAILWQVFQPLLFGLIGAQLDFAKIKPETVGYGMAVLAIGLVLRMAVSFFVVFGLKFNWKEKFFIPLAWLPKATVQAAIGSVALDEARRLPGGDPRRAKYIEYGTKILTIAVLVILVTAPIGSVLMTLTGPRLLEKNSPEEEPLEKEKPPMNGHVNTAYKHDDDSTNL